MQMILEHASGFVLLAEIPLVETIEHLHTYLFHSEHITEQNRH